MKFRVFARATAVTVAALMVIPTTAGLTSIASASPGTPAAAAQSAAVTSTKDGFQFTIPGYFPDQFSYDISTSSGIVTRDKAQVTVTKLAPGATATVTVREYDKTPSAGTCLQPGGFYGPCDTYQHISTFTGAALPNTDPATPLPGGLVDNPDTLIATATAAARASIAAAHATFNQQQEVTRATKLTAEETARAHHQAAVRQARTAYNSAMAKLRRDISRGLNSRAATARKTAITNDYRKAVTTADNKLAADLGNANNTANTTTAANTHTRDTAIDDAISTWLAATQPAHNTLDYRRMLTNSDLVTVDSGALRFIGTVTPEHAEGELLLNYPLAPGDIVTVTELTGNHVTTLMRGTVPNVTNPVTDGSGTIEHPLAGGTYWYAPIAITLNPNDTHRYYLTVTHPATAQQQEHTTTTETDFTLSPEDIRTSIEYTLTQPSADNQWGPGGITLKAPFHGITTRHATTTTYGQFTITSATDFLANQPVRTTPNNTTYVKASDLNTLRGSEITITYERGGAVHTAIWDRDTDPILNPPALDVTAFDLGPSIAPKRFGMPDTRDVLLRWETVPGTVDLPADTPINITYLSGIDSIHAERTVTTLDTVTMDAQFAEVAIPAVSVLDPATTAADTRYRGYLQLDIPTTNTTAGTPATPSHRLWSDHIYATPITVDITELHTTTLDDGTQVIDEFLVAPSRPWGWGSRELYALITPADTPNIDPIAEPLSRWDGYRSEPISLTDTHWTIDRSGGRLVHVAIGYYQPNNAFTTLADTLITPGVPDTASGLAPAGAFTWTSPGATAGTQSLNLTFRGPKLLTATPTFARISGTFNEISLRGDTTHGNASARGSNRTVTIDSQRVLLDPAAATHVTDTPGTRDVTVVTTPNHEHWYTVHLADTSANAGTIAAFITETHITVELESTRESLDQGLAFNSGGVFDVFIPGTQPWFGSLPKFLTELLLPFQFTDWVRYGTATATDYRTLSPLPAVDGVQVNRAAIMTESDANFTLMIDWDRDQFRDSYPPGTMINVFVSTRGSQAIINGSHRVISGDALNGPVTLNLALRYALEPLVVYIQAVNRSGAHAGRVTSVTSVVEELNPDSPPGGVLPVAPNPIGTPDPSNPAPPEKITTPLTAPTGLTITRASTVTLAWDSAPGADHYEVSLDGGDTWSQTTQARFTHPLTVGRAYDYRVRAVDGAGNVGPQVRAAAPGAPENVTATRTSDGSISITWGTPATDGGNPITRWMINVHDGKKWVGARNFTNAADMRTYLWQNTPAGAGRVAVLAHNEAGPSRWAYANITTS